MPVRTLDLEGLPVGTCNLCVFYPQIQVIHGKKPAFEGHHKVWHVQVYPFFSTSKQSNSHWCSPNTMSVTLFLALRLKNLTNIQSDLLSNATSPSWPFMLQTSSCTITTSYDSFLNWNTWNNQAYEKADTSTTEQGKDEDEHKIPPFRTQYSEYSEVIAILSEVQSKFSGPLTFFGCVMNILYILL